MIKLFLFNLLSRLYERRNTEAQYFKQFRELKSRVKNVKDV